MKLIFNGVILFLFIERGDSFDWEELIDKEAAVKRRITVNELLPGKIKLFLKFHKKKRSIAFAYSKRQRVK